jgi:phosphatidylglycerol:prolipoprotein diacylglycerol transferase
MVFPATIPYPRIDPVAFEIGPLSVRWYGLAYLAGFIIAYAWLGRMARRGLLRITTQALGDLISWLILGVFIGGRAGWWIFYDHNIPGPHKWYEPFAVWNGGMSFHGGLLGVLIVLIVWSRWKKVSFLNIADCAALVTPVGLFFGRIANFINGELVGRPTDVPWAMIFPGYTVPRHPSQLYEALLEGPILLALLWLIRRLRPRDGVIAAWFLILYGLIRFGVEFTRAPDEQLGYFFGWITMGQILSLIMTGCGVVMWIAVVRRSQRIEETPDVKREEAER